jgi:hypothetical protein
MDHRHKRDNDQNCRHARAFEPLFFMIAVLEPVSP